MDVLVLPMREWVVADVSEHVAPIFSEHVAPIFKVQINRTADRFWSACTGTGSTVSLFTVPNGTNRVLAPPSLLWVLEAACLLPEELTNESLLP
jgi:hypothetical protein